MLLTKCILNTIIQIQSHILFKRETVGQRASTVFSSLERTLKLFATYLENKCKKILRICKHLLFSQLWYSDLNYVTMLKDKVSYHSSFLQDLTQFYFFSVSREYCIQMGRIGLPLVPWKSRSFIKVEKNFNLCKYDLDFPRDQR